MSLVDILDNDTKKIVKAEKGLIPSVKYYDVKDYDQLKFDLKYAKDEEVFNNEFVHIYVKRYNGCLLKFILTESVEALKKVDYSNESLKGFASNRTMDEVKAEDFDLNKTITIIIIDDKDMNKELVKKFCFLNSHQDKHHYQMAFRYDYKQRIIRCYKALKDFGKLYPEYKTALYYDLAVTSLGD